MWSVLAVCFALLATPVQNTGAINSILDKHLNSTQSAAVLDLQNNSLYAHNGKMLSQMHRPGSVFKLVSAAAIIRYGLQNEVIACHGEDSFNGNERQRCWTRKGHGTVDLRQAIAQSCNIYFYSVAPKLPSNALWEQMHLWGLDRPSGFNKQENVPRVARELTTGELADCSIGDCDSIYMSGFNMLKLAAILSGSWRRAGDIEVPEELTHDMYRVVEQGTAYTARLRQYSFAGKTGTSRRMDSWRLEGWFIGFFPFEKPRFALVVFDPVGYGKNSALLASGIIRDIYDATGLAGNIE